MNITDDIKKRIKTETNLKAFLIDRYGVKSFTSSGDRCNCICPHPDHEDRNPSFSIYRDKNNVWTWQCHACHCGKKGFSKESSKKNYGNDIIALIQWMSDYKGSKHIYSFQEAAKIAAEYAGIKLEDSGFINSYYKILEHNNKVTNGLHKYLMAKNNKGYNYFVSRGLSDEDIVNWKLGYNGDRVIFPLLDRSENTRGYIRRFVKELSGEPKYINSYNNQIFRKSEYLYGIHKLDSSIDYIIITEGTFDVIGAYKYGLKNVVATLGTAFTIDHINLIKKYTPNIENMILVFDGDTAGREATRRAAKLALENGYVVNCCKLPEGMDLFDFSMKNKEKTGEIFFFNLNRYFFNEFKKFIEEYETMMLNFHGRIIDKVYDYYKSSTNPKEKLLFKFFIKDKFQLTLEEKLDDNIQEVS